VSSEYGRSPPPTPAVGQEAYAGQAAYDYPQGYGDEYDYGPYDGWWEEGTGGMFSPVRLLLGLLVLGAGAVALYGMFLDRTLLQMPITVSGLAVLGVALVLLGFSSARGAASLGRRGYGGRALLAALFGGLCVAAGAGSLAGAIVLGMLAMSA
jgi:hypothetical protein